MKWRKIDFSADLSPRWGHVACLFDNSIYIYGGRSDQDLDEMIEFNPNNRDKIKLLLN